MTTRSPIGVSSCADAAGTDPSHAVPAAPHSAHEATSSEQPFAGHPKVGAATREDAVAVAPIPHSNAQHDAAVADAFLPGGASAPIPDDVMEGYRDGFSDHRADFPQASNRSEMYRFGWLNGRDDRLKQPRATAQELRETFAAIRKGA